MITQNEVLEYFDYRDDGNLIWKKLSSPFSKVKCGDIAGCLIPEGYVTLKFKSKCYKVHRLIYLYHHGYLPEMIDHINGIRNDNRIENLRECTNHQNQCNRKLNSNNKSGVKGVYWRKDHKKWCVRPQFNNTRKYIGYFENLEDAKLAIQDFYEKNHLEFMNLG